jgi:putative SOS response-associated peptidase YedK
MCGRFTLRTPLSVLVTQFGAQLAQPLQLAINVCPTQQIPVVRLHEGHRELTRMRWGLIPSWSRDLKVGFSNINARADTVASKPAFRAAYKRRRCLVPADGYYEWKTEGKAKIPFLYEIDGGQPFAFAGLWEFWKPGDGEGEPVESCTLITTEPNELAAKVHDRMPVILDPQTTTTG